MSYKLAENCIKRLSDGAFIGLSEDNPDYREYLKWVANGNTPLPADVVPEDKTPSMNERLAAVEKVLIEKKVLSQEELTTAISVKVKG